jgi:hypothetical protein
MTPKIRSYRRRPRFALALLLAALVTPLLLTARPPVAGAKPTPGATIATTALAGVRVCRGEVVRLRYRVDGAGDTAILDLIVTDRDGDEVRHLVREKTTPVGKAQVWRGRLWLAPGEYHFAALARDARGRREKRAVPGRLTVLPPAVPSVAAVKRALAWAGQRGGTVSVAVVDSAGRLYGLHEDRRVTSASVVKAMLLVQYLREHRSVSASMQGTLARMIQYSDNAATAVVYAQVGREGLVRLAKLSGMRGFQPSGGWITTRITAADMARFFRDMDRYVPKHHRTFARRLLAGITPHQRWGIPPAAEPLGYKVYFKGGWLGAYVLANQAARLEKGRLRIGLAVFTQDNPSSGYGLETIRGTTARLLQR